MNVINDVNGNTTIDGLIANMVMKILTRLNPAEVAAFRHQRQQTHAYGRAAAFPCFEQISPDIWAVVAGLVSCNIEMWEGESSTRRYLDPLRYADDLTVLRRLINNNEQKFLDMLLDNYPGHTHTHTFAGSVCVRCKIEGLSCTLRKFMLDR